METHQPTSSTFEYVLIPADDAQPVSIRKFNGEGDEELRNSITNYFRNQASLSAGQREELKSTIMARAAENAAKNAVKPPSANEADEETASLAVATPSAAEGTNSNMSALAEDFVDHTSFEIVPVVMPSRSNRFIGTSLYIDDAGRFKELRVNSRASTISQRDIRGDAFLLSNYDDPAVDEWRRVDCNESTFESLLRNPPQSQLNTSDQASMAAATVRRENDAKRISDDDAANAIRAKLDGNAFFAEGDFKAAIQAYAHAIELLDGRRDLHQNAAELDQTLLSSYLNQSLCCGKLGQWNDALLSARAAVEVDPSSAKGYFRIAAARAALNEFPEALDALKACEMAHGSSEDIQRLRADIAESRRQFQAKQKSTYSKMFS